MRTTRRIVGVFALGILAACGGGGGGGPAATEVSLSSAAHLDGFVGSDDTVELTSGASFAGDLAGRPGILFRQVYTFPHDTLPAGADVQSATLVLEQARVTGAPFAIYGDVFVDHVDFTAASVDFDGGVVSRSIGTLSTGRALGTRTLDVTRAVRDDLAAGRADSQFRVQFDPPPIVVANEVNDFVQYTDREDVVGFGGPPRLVVRFTR